MSRVVDRARSRARVALARGGDAVARLDRRPLVHRAVLSTIPLAIQRRFDAEAAGDEELALELLVRDPSGAEPARFAIEIRGGHCRVRRGGLPKASSAVTVAGADLVRVGSGAVGWPDLVSSGRLELSGNPFEALRFPALFRLPAAAVLDASPPPRPATPRQ
jgi:alkyl sulfatase BDS1-like metallo-beta-lactamase superfamily hydrolase